MGSTELRCSPWSLAMVWAGRCSTKSAKAAKQSDYISDVLALDGGLLKKFDLKGSFNVTESEFRKLLQARWILLREIIIDSLFDNVWNR